MFTKIFFKNFQILFLAFKCFEKSRKLLTHWPHTFDIHCSKSRTFLCKGLDTLLLHNIYETRLKMNADIFSIQDFNFHQMAISSENENWNESILASFFFKNFLQLSFLLLIHVFNLSHFKRIFGLFSSTCATLDLFLPICVQFSTFFSFLNTSWSQKGGIFKLFMNMS